MLDVIALTLLATLYLAMAAFVAVAIIQVQRETGYGWPRSLSAGLLAGLFWPALII